MTIIDTCHVYMHCARVNTKVILPDWDKSYDYQKVMRLKEGI